MFKRVKPIIETDYEEAKALVYRLQQMMVLRPMPEELYSIAAEALHKAADDATKTERAACEKIAEKQRRKSSSPGGADCTSQQMHSYAAVAARDIRDKIRARGKDEE